MNMSEFGFLEVTEPVEDFPTLGRPKFRQQLQDFSFAYG